MVKVRKIAVLIALFFITVVSGVCLMNVGTEKVVADSTYPTWNNYVFTKNDDGKTFELDTTNNVLSVKVKEEAVVSFKNQFVLDNLEFGFNIGSSVTGFKINVKSNSYDPNYYNEETKDNTVKLSLDVTKTGSFAVSFNVVKGVLTANVGGSSTTFSENNQILSKDSPALATIEFVIDEIDGTNDAFAFDYIDYNNETEGQNKQLFESDFAYAKPRVVLSDIFYNAFDGVNHVRYGFEYSVSPKVYSAFANYNSSEISFEGVEKTNVISDSKISFNSVGDYEFNAIVKNSEGDKVCETFKGEVVTIGERGANEEDAPKYIEDDFAYENFKSALLDRKIWKDGNKDQGIYVSVGSGQYLEIPSLKALVKSNAFNYSELKITVAYKTDKTSSTYSSLKLPISEVGKYVFYVLFADPYENKMEDEDFVKFDQNDGNVIIEETLYKNFVFNFELLDNAPILIETVSQENGYVGVEYKAEAFDITAYNCNKTYKLEYKSSGDVNSNDGWKEIKTSSTSESEFNDNSPFSYKDNKAFNYDGNLTFTPTQKGYYKLSVTVTSQSLSSRSETASVIIEVKDQVKVVKPDTHWLENNLLSVIFLGIGTLCLIGIVVLLFIKPKEKVEEPEKEIIE